MKIIKWIWKLLHHRKQSTESTQKVTDLVLPDETLIELLQEIKHRARNLREIDQTGAH